MFFLFIDLLLYSFIDCVVRYRTSMDEFGCDIWFGTLQQIGGTPAQHPA
jgi:hypothetical protein